MVLIRFESEDRSNQGLGGKHISAAFDVTNNKLMGLVRMVPELDNSSFVSHEEALETAIKFLQVNAPDLIDQEVIIPQLTKLENGSRIEFDQNDERLNFGKVQVYWIDDHAEAIIINGEQKEIHGMKVKMYVPEQELYTWVIVDKNSEVLVFERDISWDFSKFQRNTQMWLHDSWILAQGIVL